MTTNIFIQALTEILGATLIAGLGAIVYLFKWGFSIDRDVKEMKNDIEYLKRGQVRLENLVIGITKTLSDHLVKKNS